jgi:starvation-inducible DNA-binding protein
MTTAIDPIVGTRGADVVTRWGESGVESGRLVGLARFSGRSGTTRSGGGQATMEQKILTTEDDAMTQALKPEFEAETLDHAQALQATLVELIDLALQGKQAHWNVTGPAFKPVHEFLDELVDDYRGWYDDVAERLAAIGVSPDGRSLTVADSSPLDQLPPGPIADQAALTSMDERVTMVAAHIRERADALGDDLASQDLLIEVLRGLEKQRWMIRAHRT